MNILVIGNGFDLAHGLPTKYTDFLEWIKEYRKFYTYMEDENINKYKEISEGESSIFNVFLNGYLNSDYFRSLFLEDSRKKLCDEIYELVYENIWIDYFLKYDVHQRENWIDFEREISRVIQSVDSDMISNEGKKYELTDIMMTLSNEFLNQKYFQYTYSVQSVKALTEGRGETITFKKIRDNLYDDLKKLIRILEIYLTDYVGQFECNMISPDICEVAQKVIEIDNEKKEIIRSKVLNFNYTNTYEKIYWGECSSEGYIDYIHGKANISNVIESNNMVLGIDEYLPAERKNREVEFISFKKFYQRIHKGTGCKYKEWIDKIKNELKYGSDNRVFIFGHSLDITDGDVLRELILTDNIYTTIFYLNKEIMGQQIANLVKVIGQDELIKRTGGSTKTIEFRQQREMVKR